MTYGNCATSFTNRYVNVSENKRKFCLVNQNELEIIKVVVDGCLITGSGKRCDYLFDFPTLNLIYYVELKGRDIESAVKQLKATLSFCRVMHDGKSKECHIVSSRVPLGPKVQILKLEFLKTTGCGLRIKTNINTLKIS